MYDTREPIYRCYPTYSRNASPRRRFNWSGGSLSVTVSKIAGVALPTLTAATGILYDTAGIVPGDYLTHGSDASINRRLHHTVAHLELPLLNSTDCPTYFIRFYRVALR